MPLFAHWKRKTVPPPLGGLPEVPVQARTLMWNSDRYTRWGPILSTTSTTTSIHHSSRTEDPVLTEHYFPILIRCLLSSNLGVPDKQYTLRFCCIIPGDRPLAMFTTARSQSKIAWCNGPNRGRCVPETRWWRRNALPRVREKCTLQCTVSNRWHYQICHRAIIRWDPHWEMVLVDHKALLADYEAQEKDEKNRKRVKRILENYHACEREQLWMTTGGGWSDWGDWDIWPATLPEVAQTCRVQGREYEERLAKGRRPGSGKRCKIRRCFTDVSRRLKKVFSKS